jgi:hypothetical protein
VGGVRGPKRMSLGGTMHPVGTKAEGPGILLRESVVHR